MTTAKGLPLNDLKDHTPLACCCGPKEEMQPNGNFIVIHHSFDGREAAEQAFRKEPS